MRIMSERRFREELERAKSEVYQQERLDNMYHELSGRIDVIQRDLFDLRCKVEGPAEKQATTRRYRDERVRCADGDAE